MNRQYNLLAVMIIAALSGCQGEENTSLESGTNNIYLPTVKGEVVAPSLHVGSKVQGKYEFFDPNVQPRLEGVSLYSWRDDTANEISKKRELQLGYEHLDMNLSFCVTPVAQGNINTVGIEVCSTPQLVKEPLAPKPEAYNVIIDNDAMPTVGDSLEGSYLYSHQDNFSEGSSEFSWKADGHTIIGAIQKTITLKASETEGKEISFCVIPVTQISESSAAIKGEQVCSELTEKVLPLVGQAPTVDNVKISGSPFVHAKLTGEYTYNDDDGDNELNSTFIWKRNNTIIFGADTVNYDVVSDDVGSIISFCTTPKAATGLPNLGQQICTSMDKPIEEIVEEAPEAKSVAISFDGNHAVIDTTLHGQYEFIHSGGSEKGNADIEWRRNGSLVKSCTEDEANCTSYTISDNDLTNENIEYCVKAKTLYETPASDFTCSSSIVASAIKLKGKLEYNAEITAVGFGDFQDLSAIEWRINTSTQDGPLGDTDPGSRMPIAGATGSSSYRIGVAGSATSDYDWDYSSLIDARNFIGKQLDVCIETYCINASNSSDISGGMFVDETAMRTIEPVRIVILRDSADPSIALKYHRPLTLAESNNKKYGSTPIVSESIELNGIKWALPKHENKEVLDICRNLYNDKTWFVPQTQFSGNYILNIYDGENKPSPDYTGAMTKAKATIINLTKTLISNNNNSSYLNSPVFGWPIGPVKNNTDTGDIVKGYIGATFANKQQNFNVVRFYANGGTANNGKASEGFFVSCISE
ncbi:TPA: hypothetical protein ACX6QL_001690 [Photobacterium damselae]